MKLDEMNDYRRRVIDILLDKGIGHAAVRVYRGDDPGHIRTDLRERGYLQGDDDEIAEALFDWVADDVGADELL